MSELERLKKALPEQPLVERACPLAARLRSLAEGILSEAPILEANDQHVIVVLCTQGLPTNKDGRYTPEAQRDFLRELQALGDLTVKIIVRMCSNNEDVVERFNSLDYQLASLDVLGDFWGEVRTNDYIATRAFFVWIRDEILGAQTSVVGSEGLGWGAAGEV